MSDTYIDNVKAHMEAERAAISAHVQRFLAARESGAADAAPAEEELDRRRKQIEASNAEQAALLDRRRALVDHTSESMLGPEALARERQALWRAHVAEGLSYQAIQHEESKEREERMRERRRLEHAEYLAESRTQAARQTAERKVAEIEAAVAARARRDARARKKSERQKPTPTHLERLAVGWLEAGGCEKPTHKKLCGLAAMRRFDRLEVGREARLDPDVGGPTKCGVPTPNVSCVPGASTFRDGGADLLRGRCRKRYTGPELPVYTDVGMVVYGD